MSTIHETIADNQLASKKEFKISLFKTRKELALQASTKKSSEKFHSINIDLMRIPSVSANNTNDNGPIVIDINAGKACQTKSGFIPKIVCISGLNTLKKAKANLAAGTTKGPIRAWIGNRVFASKISIMADDAISCNDLTSKLRKLVDANYTKKSNVPYSDDNYAYIIEVYPFENYLIFSKGGEKYRQTYKLDAIMREVSLDGTPVKVFEQYVAVPDSKGVKKLNATSSSILETLLDPVNNVAPALGARNGPMIDKEVGGVFTYFGAPGSEANNPAIKLMLNVEDALAMYQDEKANGIHKVIYTPLAPIPPGLVNAEREARIAAELASISNFSAMDFMQWQNKKLKINASERFKVIDKRVLSASQFAYIGDFSDISTWQAPMDSINAAKQSLKDFSALNIPKKQHVQVISRLKAVAGPVIGKGKPAHHALKKLKMKRNGGQVAIC